MVDLSQMSDSDLAALAKGDVKSMSDEGLAHIAGPEPTTGKQYLQGAVDALPAVGGIVGGLVGTGADEVLGPYGTIKGAAIGGYLGTAAKNAANSYLNPPKTPQTIPETVGGAMTGGLEQAGQQAIGEGIIAPVVNKASGLIKQGYGAVKNAVQSASADVGQNITGMPKALTKNYMPNTDKINDLIATWGDNDADFAQAVRKKWMSVIQAGKASLYGVRDAAIDGGPKDIDIDVTPIIDKLEASKSGLNPSLDKGAIDEIDQHIWVVKQLSKRTSNPITMPEGMPSLPGNPGSAQYEAQQAGLPPTNPTTKISGKNAKQIVNIPKSSPVSPQHESMGLPSPSSPSAPNKAGPFPQQGPEALENFRQMSGLPPSNPVSTSGGPSPSDLQTISQLNSTGVNPYDLQNPETYHTSIQNLHKIKGYLQNVAKASYNSGGQIFSTAPEAAQAARGAGAVSRRIFIDEAPSAASGAEKSLANLHGIEESMNSNLINPDAPFHSLTQAGSNPGGTPAKTLKDLGKVIPYDFLQDAKDFATAQAFRNAGLTPMDTTGKSVARQALTYGPGAALGWVTGSAVGHPEAGAFIGGKFVSPYLSSPGLMKSVINASNSATKPVYGLLNAAQNAAPIIGPRLMTRGLLNGQQ